MNQDITNAIRQAMSSEQFETAHHLWDEYAGSVREAIENGTASEAMMTEHAGTGRVVARGRPELPRARVGPAKPVARRENLRPARLLARDYFPAWR